MNYLKRYNALENYGEDDEEFLELAMIVAFPIKSKVIRERPDHFEIWNDEQFFQRFRMSKETVQFILELIGEKISSLTNMNSAVSASAKLLLTIRYYATGSFLSVCGDFSGVHKCTASRIVRSVSHELASLRPKFINFPESENEINHVRQGFYDIAKFPQCIGAIDCTHVKIRSPGGTEAEIYRNRKGYFSFNVQTICDANLRIQNIVCRWPGSTHDSTIWDSSSIRGKFETNEMKGGVLVGDSGYASKKYLLTPFRNPTSEGQNRYNESQTRTRNPVERSYGVWKRRFPILAVGINLNVTSVESVVVATAVLHNIACHFGNAVPRVTANQEHLINVGQFRQGFSDVVDRVTEHTLKRAQYVTYFESL